MAIRIKPTRVIFGRYESRRRLGSLWEPVPRGRPDGRLALPLLGFWGATGPGCEPGNPGGRGQRPIQNQVDLGVEQCQIWSVVPRSDAAAVCFCQISLALWDWTGFSLSGWSLKQKSKFSKTSAVIMFGQSYELRDRGEAFLLFFVWFLVTLTLLLPSNLLIFYPFWPQQLKPPENYKN